MKERDHGLEEDRFFSLPAWLLSRMFTAWFGPELRVSIEKMPGTRIWDHAKMRENATFVRILFRFEKMQLSS